MVPAFSIAGLAGNPSRRSRGVSSSSVAVLPVDVPAPLPAWSVPVTVMAWALAMVRSPVLVKPPR